MRRAGTNHDTHYTELTEIVGTEFGACGGKRQADILTHLYGVPRLGMHSRRPGHPTLGQALHGWVGGVALNS